MPDYDKIINNFLWICEDLSVDTLIYIRTQISEVLNDKLSRMTIKTEEEENDN